MHKIHLTTTALPTISGISGPNYDLLKTLNLYRIVAEYASVSAVFMRRF